MPLTQEQPILSGNLVIDGTLEAKHIKANTITANKFSGAVEEEYWAYNDDVDVSWSTSVFTTAHTFNFPATELEIKKGRHVHWSAEGFQNTATSSIQSGSFYFQLEAEVPSGDNKTEIGAGVHLSFPVSGYQIVGFEGNTASNRIGSSGSIGLSDGSYRTYKQVYYDPKGVQGSDLVTNGTFSTNTTGWTVGAGAFAVNTARGRLNAVNGGQGFVYQQITTVAGELYQLTANINDGTANAEIRITSAPNLDSSSQIATSGVETGTASVDFEFVATGTTAYIVLATNGAVSQYQYVDFDNIVCKQYIKKTYIMLSTTGGQLCPTDGTPVTLYHHPYGGASAGTWAIVDYQVDSRALRSYSNYLRFSQEAYIGFSNVDIKLRLRVKNLGAYNKTLTMNDMKFFMQSRIVE